jgi:hypothetical protein
VAPGPRERGDRGGCGDGLRPCRARRRAQTRAALGARVPAAGSVAPRRGARRLLQRRRESASPPGGRATSIHPALPRARTQANGRPHHRRAEAEPALRDGRTRRRHAPPTGRTLRFRNRAELDEEGARPAPRRRAGLRSSAEPTPSTFPASHASGRRLAQRTVPTQSIRVRLNLSAVDRGLLIGRGGVGKVGEEIGAVRQELRL